MLSRRGFLYGVGSSGLLTAWPRFSPWQVQVQVPQSQASSPELTTGQLVPLTEANVARPMRYTASGGGFTIRNGAEFFNRPLYGPGVGFRADGGDRPEFSLYLPGHGGNLRLALLRADGSSKWLFELESVECMYVDGRLEYRLHDAWLGGAGSLTLRAVTTRDSLLVQVESAQAAKGLAIGFAFGGVSGRKGKRGGDLGCEVEPVSQFFQLRPEECAGNVWELSQDASQAQVVAKAATLRVEAPGGTGMAIGDAGAWNRGWSESWSAKSAEAHFPVLLGRWPLKAGAAYLTIRVVEKAPEATPPVPAAETFTARLAQLHMANGQLRMTTPDPHLDAMAAALCIAKDALWDEAQGCIMHGAVAWRQAFAGWRGPYAFDALGDHERMRSNLRHWIAKQNHEPVRNGNGGTATAQGFAGIVNAKGAPDAGSHGARSEGLLHANGDLVPNHYDMNLVFFDGLLRHLRWTGDRAFAEEAWPALEAHAAWERRSFRRDYQASETEETLPLYEAYAAIWASDNLQYNGGGTAHGSAYNVYLNERLAELSVLLGKPAEVAAAYHAEAAAIRRAVEKLLWMPEQGAYAESRDWLEPRVLLESPALWTVYQTIDSGMPTEKQAWQAVAERLGALRRIPVKGEGVPADAGWILPSSDWLPYLWSLTLVNLGENLAMSLAMFQAGMADEAYTMLRGSLLDAGFRGLCPGNFPMSVALDPHRQESQRDFGDPIGCASRAIVEGLWGVDPDLLHGRVRLRPQLPLAWNSATLEHRELSIRYSRTGGEDRWQIEHAFAGSPEITLELRGRTVEMPHATVNGAVVTASFVPGAVGEPRLRLVLPRAARADVRLRWHGAAPVDHHHATVTVGVGGPVRWPAAIEPATVDDPEGFLQEDTSHGQGNYTVFAHQSRSVSRHWVPVTVSRVLPPAKLPPRLPFTAIPLALDGRLNAHARDILSRGYDAPRSGLCSLNLPSGLLGGWADFDAKAKIDDAGLRGTGGRIALEEGLYFALPAGPEAPNCRFLSHWAQDQPELAIPVSDRAQALHLLLVGTTFPQACWTPHATVRLDYADGSHWIETLRSPVNWWPVEQDYMVDDYIFRIRKSGEAAVMPLFRVDLGTAKVRAVDPGKATPGGRIAGGSAFTVRVEADPARSLAKVTLRCELYGIVMGLLAMTLERPDVEQRTL